MKNDLQTPELLAPAGDLQTAVAAFDSGADAVYAGLQRFNARERGTNFSRDDMARLMALAADRGRRVYVTLNILLKETELPAVADIIAELSLLQPDAVIVQDIGLIRMLRNYVPGLPIHASTQMGTHNTAGTEMLQQMGVERVILERQLTLDEVKTITRESPIETEVFVHGALCCSLSGMCLLSSWMGGWSGNRGKCKQPCRRRYHSENGNGFFLSTRDLYTLDLLPELCAAGVASLKIEGRLKPAQYVADVVRAYRLLLDTPARERKQRLGEARSILARAPGRKWSHGFYSEPVGESIIEPEKIGAAGRLVGLVQSTDQEGFSLKCLQAVRTNDRLRVQPPSGEEGASFTVRLITCRGKKASRLNKGQTGHISFEGEVPADGRVYKLGYETTPKSSDNSLPQTDTATPECFLSLAVHLSRSGIECRIKTPLFSKVWTEKFAVEAARSRPLTEANLTAEFSKMPPAGVGIRKVFSHVEGEFFVPFKQMRNIRRKFWQWVEEAVLPRVRTATYDSANLRDLQTACGRPMQAHPKTLSTPVATILREDKSPAANRKADVVYAEPVAEFDTASAEAILPEFCPETEIPGLAEQINRAYHLGCRRFRITALFGLRLLAKYDDIMITAGFPLPTANSMAAKELHALGVQKMTAWVELDREGLAALAEKVNGSLEIMRESFIPLLVTRADIPVRGHITDSRGGEFYVASATGLTRVYSGKPLVLPEIPGTGSFIDRRLPATTRGEPEGSKFNYDREWQ